MAISFPGDDLGCEEGQQPDNLKTKKKQRSERKEVRSDFFFFSPPAPSPFSLLLQAAHMPVLTSDP